MTLCYSDVETREALRRLKEVAYTFGMGNSSGYRNNPELTSDVEHLKAFVSFLKQGENKRQPWHGKSPQIKYRKFLVDFVMRLCEWENLKSETTYLAIYLLDRFMDQHDIIVDQLGMVAAVCLSVSGKLFETNNKSPSYRKLTKYLKKFSIPCCRRLVELEAYVLDAFSFDIVVPTEINFLEIYLLYIVDGRTAIEEEDDNNNNNNNCIMYPNANYPGGIEMNIEAEFNQKKSSLAPSKHVNGAETLNAMCELAFLILQEITLSGEPSNSFRPSLIAAAILLASRREHGLNFWTPTLQMVTSYNLQQVCQCLVTCLEPMLSKLNLKQPFSTPTFLNIIFEPYITVDVEEEEEDDDDSGVMSSFSN